MCRRLPLLGLFAGAALFACGRAPSVECSPGGRCSPAADRALRVTEAALGLSDLRRRDRPPELRIWSISWDEGAGILTRSRDRGTNIERYAWWPASASSDSIGVKCADRRATRSGVATCRLADPLRPYAGYVLRNLEAHGLLTLPGGALPTCPYGVPMCPKDQFFDTSVFLVEVRDSTRYRTYGYTLPPAGTASEAVWFLDLLLHAPPFS